MPNDGASSFALTIPLSYAVVKMKAFNPYVSRLQNLLLKSTRAPSEPDHQAAIEAALDGQPSAELRRCVSLARLRSAGAFFTGSAMARRAIAAGFSQLKANSTVLDPACGVGDLLVAFAEHLPHSGDLTSTLQAWGCRILGRDLQPEFVRATKLRLALAAIRGAEGTHALDLPKINELFPGIVTGCSLADEEPFAAASHIVINPPFTRVQAPPTCEWASGKVNSAAVFMETCINRSQPMTRIIAILPDVLRSGSRYEKWRKFFEERVSLSKVEVVGQFDRNTDVDVFIAVGTVRKRRLKTSRLNWARPEKPKPDTVSIGERFHVSVGPVVPHRDPHRGSWYPFIHAREMPPWGVVSSISHHRRFLGRTFESPFVVVRRTSRPGDKRRAIGTIVDGTKPIAVENHLLVLQPKDHSLATCAQLIKLLRRDITDEILNRRIRCRHLTVPSLAELPWSDG